MLKHFCANPVYQTTWFSGRGIYKKGIRWGEGIGWGGCFHQIPWERYTQKYHKTLLPNEALVVTSKLIASTCPHRKSTSARRVVWTSGIERDAPLVNPSYVFTSTDAIPHTIHSIRSGNSWLPLFRTSACCINSWGSLINTNLRFVPTCQVNEGRCFCPDASYSNSILANEKCMHRSLSSSPQMRGAQK
jgi:hypothetical protein